MLATQKELFDLPAEVSYLNCASISPLLRNLAQAGQDALALRSRPYQIGRDDWFEPPKQLRQGLARLIHCREPQRIAFIPSVSYGMAIAAKNVSLAPGEEIVLASEQFPSNYYSWHKLAQASGGRVVSVWPPKLAAHSGRMWNERILEAIDDQTKVVALGIVHWTDGTRFDLEAISQKAKAHGALLILDGTQAIGAMPFDVQAIQPDALFCAGYKWLLGPLSLGFAYLGPYFDQGEPLEENWINRQGSDDFQNLVAYPADYRPLAGRYNVGEHANFQSVAMMQGALEQILTWSVPAIQAYCQALTQSPIEALQVLGCQFEEPSYRVPHILGIRFDPTVDLKRLQAQLIEQKVYASLRGTALRVSVHLYNDERDMEKLVDCVKQSLTGKP